jgi:aromatic ring-opening dioxygenase catalytic subunit (LigB family)
VLFVSHGSPTFAIEPGIAGPALTALGRALPRPEAVLVVSPHWSTREPRVATTLRPQTLHDFGGFPPALYQLQYPAPGALVWRRVRWRCCALRVGRLRPMRSGGWTTALGCR